MNKKTILITGASTGIGRTTALHFQRQGWNVIATMRSPENETDVAETPNVLVTKLDVTDEASIDAAVAKGIAQFGQIDVLLNNAGYGAYGPLEAFSMEKIKRRLIWVSFSWPNSGSIHIGCKSMRCAGSNRSDLGFDQLRQSHASSTRMIKQCLQDRAVWNIAAFAFRYHVDEGGFQRSRTASNGEH